MIPTIILMMAQVATPPPVPVPPPAAEWAALAPLPWRAPPQLAPDVTAFVAAEVKAGRCTPAKPGPLSLDLAVSVADSAEVKTAVPLAIGCPTVEQFAAGLVTGFARNNLRDPAPGWYRVTVSFTLPQ